MKLITEIRIDNYKAYIQERSFPIPNGENILLYGENGSGKSSLYKALRFFLSSSVGEGRFEMNRYSGQMQGAINITYKDVDPITGQLIDGTEQTYTIHTDIHNTNNGQPFIKLSYRVSGFLDYSKLLKVYLNDSSRPDLFHLILDLVGDFIPTAYGMTSSLKDEMIELLEEIRGAYHRSDRAYRSGILRFNDWSSAFIGVIALLNAELSRFFSTYFSDMNLQISLNMPPIVFVDASTIKSSGIDGHIYIDVSQYGQAIANYNDKLNEARLSAIAICLYLASLKLKAQNVESKVLFLDDVFLGLDLGNRKPVLDIIMNEFQDYQVFISTYDRSWYEQAKEILENNPRWTFFELFDGTFEIAVNTVVNNPIVLRDDSLFNTACSYLNNNERPDYPAAANYLRKAYEELLMKCFIPPAVMEENCDFIPSYKLAPLVKACKGFVAQLPRYFVSQANIMSYLTELLLSLHPLLHPLSHYVPSVPVYKAELNKAIRLFEAIKSEASFSEYHEHCRVFWEKGHKVKLVINGVSGWWYEYMVKLLDTLYLYDDDNHGKSLSEGLCRVYSIIEHIPGQPDEHRLISDTHPIANTMRYSSLEDCKVKILNFLANSEGRNDPVVNNWMDSFLLSDDGVNYETISHRIANFVWT